MRSLLASLTAVCALLAVASPSFAQAQPPTALPVVDLKPKDPVSYGKEIEPRFYKKCTVCHSGKELKGKLDLGNYETLIKGGQRGAPVIPGKGAESLIYKSMLREVKPFMPPKGE